MVSLCSVDIVSVTSAAVPLASTSFSQVHLEATWLVVSALNFRTRRALKTFLIAQDFVTPAPCDIDLSAPLNALSFLLLTYLLTCIPSILLILISIKTNMCVWRMPVWLKTPSVPSTWRRPDVVRSFVRSSTSSSRDSRAQSGVQTVCYRAMCYDAECGIATLSCPSVCLYRSGRPIMVTYVGIFRK